MIQPINLSVFNYCFLSVYQASHFLQYLNHALIDV